MPAPLSGMCHLTVTSGGAHRSGVSPQKRGVGETKSACGLCFTIEYHIENIILPAEMPADTESG